MTTKKLFTRFEELTKETLESLGFSCRLSGYEYLKFCIVYFLENGEDISLTKHIYPACAKRYNCSIESVDRSIRFCIKQCWINGDAQRQSEIFDGYIRHDAMWPSSYTFIKIIARRISSLIAQ